MNIALIGNGSMGQATGRIAQERGHTISAIIDPSSEHATHQTLTPEGLEGVDVVIDFSLADAVEENVRICSEAGVNLVIGTTGWYDRLDNLRETIESSDIGCLWSSNFSIGVNLYFKIIEEASKLVNQFDEYDVWGHEIHHFNKADSPSGTAQSLAQILIKNIDRKTDVVDEKLDRRREPNEIHFSSVRGGEVNFRHDIGFDSAADTITIIHSARNRDGYALGAVKAAEWLKGRTGFFEMQDFLQIN